MISAELNHRASLSFKFLWGKTISGMNLIHDQTSYGRCCLYISPTPQRDLMHSYCHTSCLIHASRNNQRRSPCLILKHAASENNQLPIDETVLGFGLRLAYCLLTAVLGHNCAQRASDPSGYLQFIVNHFQWNRKVNDCQLWSKTKLEL